MYLDARHVFDDPIDFAGQRERYYLVRTPGSSRWSPAPRARRSRRAGRTDRRRRL